MRDEIAQLAKALEPSFTAPEDAELAATMMVMALRYELGRPATEADQLRYQAALERLPKGSTATPSVVFVSPYDQKTDRHWRVTVCRCRLPAAPAAGWAGDFSRAGAAFVILNFDELVVALSRRAQIHIQPSPRSSHPRYKAALQVKLAAARSER